MAYINGKEILFSAIININSLTLAQIQTPTVSISSEGKATWSKPSGTVSFCYKKNNGTEVSTNLDYVYLKAGDTISVKAVGDGKTYADSAYSTEKTYKQTLGTPQVTVSADGKATWTPITNASQYRYYINNGATKYTSNTSVQLTNVGDRIRVQATGDSGKYNNSPYSDVQTYLASIYYGVGTVEGDAITDEFITGLTGETQESRVCSFTVSPTTQYIYFSAPKSYCINDKGTNATVFTINDFKGGFIAPVTVEINGIEYYVYRSAQKLTGDVPVNVT